MTQYSLLNFEQSSILLDSFNQLPVDQYLKPEDGAFRFRRYHTGQIKSQYLSWDKEPNYFEQSVDLNNYGGGIKRAFKSMSPAVLDKVGQHLILPHLTQLPQNDYIINVHQIRIMTNETFMGKPAPEGLHQDGFDYVVVFCIHTENIIGGNSLLFDLTNGTDSIVDHVLEPGQAILFSDKTYRHYVSPIVPRIPGTGYRDVFVATFQKIQPYIVSKGR